MEFVDENGLRLVLQNIKGYVDTQDTKYVQGYNIVNSLTSVPVDKRSVWASVSTNQTFNLDSSELDTMPSGEEIHIIVQNTSTSDISVAISTASQYVRLSGDSFTVKASSYGEINVLRLGDKYFVRTL